MVLPEKVEASARKSRTNKKLSKTRNNETVATIPGNGKFLPPIHSRRSQRLSRIKRNV